MNRRMKSYAGLYENCYVPNFQTQQGHNHGHNNSALLKTWRKQILNLVPACYIVSHTVTQYVLNLVYPDTTCYTSTKYLVLWVYDIMGTKSANLEVRLAQKHDVV